MGRVGGQLAVLGLELVPLQLQFLDELVLVLYRVAAALHGFVCVVGLGVGARV